MNKLTVNKELTVIEVTLIIFEALEKLGIDTKSLTIAEMYQIKTGLFKGIDKVNDIR